jgi:hypothetical protein
MRWACRCCSVVLPRRRTARCARSSRVVLIPRRWYHARDDASHHTGNGGQKARSTGENAKQPFQPSRREGRDVSAEPVVLPRAFFLHAGHGSGELPAFPAPSDFGGRNDSQDSDAKAGARMMRHVSSSSLRAKRSNPDYFLGNSLDCFGASRLAMTALRSPGEPSRRRRPGGRAANLRRHHPRRRAIQ